MQPHGLAVRWGKSVQIGFGSAFWRHRGGSCKIINRKEEGRTAGTLHSPDEVDLPGCFIIELGEIDC